MSDKQGSNIPWWAIILGFIFFWPAGLILLFLNLGGVSIPTGSQDNRSYTAQRRQTPPPTASTRGQVRSGTGAGAAPRQTQSGVGPTAQGSYHYSYGQTAPGPQSVSGRGTGKGRLFKKIRDGKAMTAIGAFMSFIFGIGFVDEISYGLSRVSEWFPLFGFLCAGLCLTGMGISKTRLARRQRLYQGVIGQRSSIFLSDLAATAGVSEKKVLSDLQKMLADGALPTGYIDRASGRLVLTDQGYEPPASEPKRTAEPSKAQTKAASEDPDAAILRQIREVNDAIPDPELTRKIARIEEITGKILAYQKGHPAKAPELRQFLNYYLPTTLKILNAYAQMDAQGIQGENISAAKARIEGMMDKVVEGFEKQLDQLFQTDAMDIATDVEVLERMLDKDGLGSGMTLGG